MLNLHVPLHVWHLLNSKLLASEHINFPAPILKYLWIPATMVTRMGKNRVRENPYRRVRGGIGVCSFLSSHFSFHTGISAWELCPHFCQVKKRKGHSWLLSLSNPICSVCTLLCTCLFTYRRPQEYHHYSWRSHCRFGSLFCTSCSSVLCDYLALFRTSFSNLVSNQVQLAWSCCGAWTYL